MHNRSFFIAQKENKDYILLANMCLLEYTQMTLFVEFSAEDSLAYIHTPLFRSACLLGSTGYRQILWCILKNLTFKKAVVFRAFVRNFKLRVPLLYTMSSEGAS